MLVRFAVPRVGAESAVGWGCGASGMCWRAFPLVDRAVCLSDQEVFLVEGLSAIGVSCFILV